MSWKDSCQDFGKNLLGHTQQCQIQQGRDQCAGKNGDVHFCTHLAKHWLSRAILSFSLSQATYNHRFTQDDNPKYSSNHGKIHGSNAIYWWKTPAESLDLSPTEIYGMSWRSKQDKKWSLTQKRRGSHSFGKQWTEPNASSTSKHFTSRVVKLEKCH